MVVPLVSGRISMGIASINPATGELLRSFEEIDDREIERKLKVAAECFRAERRFPPEHRTEKMRRAAEILESEAERWGRLITQEMGKPLKSAIAEAKKCADCCRHYAENATIYLAPENIPIAEGKAYVCHLPIGVVLAVMPWNFPFWQVFRFAAPALMAGNVGVLKHASNVPQCALALEEIFTRAGFPQGAFQTLLIGPNKVPKLIEDPRIAAVTLTGSDAAGSAVASTAGKFLKKTVLELGGSDPFIVMPSADLKAAVKTAVIARTINNGQSCIAAKRFIVHREIYQAFEEQLVNRLGSLKVGDPMREDTDLGPLATSALLDTLDSQVKESVRQGARLLIGGKRREGAGNYYLPTALAQIPRSAPAYKEELFGPVALLFKAHDIDDAIGLANDNPYGLGSSVWTRDDVERERFVQELEAGATFVNMMVASDPRLPFGGIKRSGYGRELSREGIREFVNIKTVRIADNEESTVE